MGWGALIAIAALVVLGVVATVHGPPHASRPVGGGPHVSVEWGLAPSALRATQPLSAHDLVRSAAGGGEARLIVNSTDAAAVPNTGLRVNLTAYLAGTLPAGSAFQVGAEEVIGSYDAVFGIFQNDRRYPVPFFSVFSNVTDQTVHLAYWSNTTLSAGTSYEFVLTATAGTVWTLTMNGALFADNASAASFNFGATDATWAGGVSFSEIAFYSATSPTPSEVDVPLAFAVLETGGWYLPRQGAAYTLAPSASTWGAAGRLQHPALAPGELITGTAVPPVANGTVLWTGGPVPVSVTVTPSRSVAPSIFPVPVTVVVRASNGSSLPGVALELRDSIGGSFTPPEVTTNASGSAITSFATPNVTAAQDDLVQARVTLFGYAGFGAATVHLTPAIELFLRAAPPTISVAAGSIVNVSVLASNVSGGLVSGVLIVFSIAQGTFDSSPFAFTDGAGATWVRVIAPGTGSSFMIRASVSAPGYWGHTSVNVSIVAPPPSLVSKIAPYLVGGILGMAVALAVGLVLWDRRRRRAIPPLRFLAEARAAVEETAASTRTPP